MRLPTDGRPDPDKLLKALSAGGRGRHKVYVGMAAGVGKTVRALAELRELQAAGRGVTIGVLETHGRAETQAAAVGLPVFPLRQVPYKGAFIAELNLEGLLADTPQVVLVDELAHSNVPGSRHAKRYEDVQDLLAAGINVISTVNIQHLESLNDLITRLTGVRVRERVPDSVLREASEVVLVDVTPEALQERLRAGKIYAPDKIDQALGNFFTTGNLSALREVALRQVADTVEAETGEGRVRERVLVAVSLNPEATRLIRRGGRVAERLNATLDVLHVQTRSPTREDGKLLHSFQIIAEALGGSFKVIQNTGGVTRTLVNYAREQHSTEIIIGEGAPRPFGLPAPNLAQQLMRHTEGAAVTIIARQPRK